MSLKDYFIIIIKSIICTALIALLVVICYQLISFNHNFAYYISNITGIPSDLTLTMISAGFTNNIIILMSVIELALFVWVIDKITKTSIYNIIRDFLVYL